MLRKPLPWAVIFLAFGPSISGAAAADDDAQPLTGVLERLRQEIGYYEVQAAHRRGELSPSTPDPAMVDESGNPLTTTYCPIANFDFDVTRIEASFETVSSSLVSGNAGLKIPFSGNAGVNRSKTTSQITTVVLDRFYEHKPAALAAYEADTDYKKLAAAHDTHAKATVSQGKDGNPASVFPIGETLIELRENLIRAAAKPPCFDVVGADGEKPSHHIRIEFSVQKAQDAKIGFNLVVVSLGADGTRQNDLKNTVTVSFASHKRSPSNAPPASDNSERPAQVGARPGEGVRE